MQDRPEADHVEAVASGYYGNHKGDLEQGIAERELHGVDGGGKGPPEHRAHGDVEQRQGEKGRERELGPEDPDLAFLGGLVLVHLLACIDGKGFVACLLDRLLDRGNPCQGRVIGHKGFFGGEVHRRARDSRDLPHGPLDGGRT